MGSSPPIRWAIASGLWAILEVAVIIAAFEHLGVLATVAFLLGSSVLGLTMVLRQGTGVFKSLRRTVRSGQVPSAEIVDGCLLLLAAVLFIVPGFISDFFAALLLVPVIRKAVQARTPSLLRRFVSGRLGRLGDHFGAGDGPFPAKVVRVGAVGPPITGQDGAAGDVQGITRPPSGGPSDSSG
ncbi:MAG: FxsA family protein [Actinomycetota bacterium]|nr:FxsA family protein [Actinomycetota bacterium]